MLRAVGPSLFAGALIMDTQCQMKNYFSGVTEGRDTHMIIICLMLHFYLCGTDTIAEIEQ